eukprot:TRINITY_DN9341_c0_g1_i3.p1 TRINITY_DN9341_c0_g1~~TRINITY_DN9341_c0_g1_i3.p1  ORF type:complete len:221 (+),score=41.61 TRINITY_DN9341_c0_g1_i3:61-723(+)
MLRSLVGSEMCIRDRYMGGLLSISTEPGDCVLAYMDPKREGSVGVKNYGTGRTLSIDAHRSPLTTIQLSPNGERLATTSEKGTLIRVFDCTTGEHLHEFRRGIQHMPIYSLAFHVTNEWLVATSDSGTVHIFNLSKSAASKNAKSKLSFLSVVSNYFESEWSFAQFRMKEKNAKSRAVFLGADFTISVANDAGKAYTFKFDPEKGGECIADEEIDLLSQA